MAAINEYIPRAQDANLDKRQREAAKALVEADRRFNKWELDAAVAASQNALKLFREVGNQTGVADALYVLIRSLGSQENVDDASGMARSELAMFRSLGDAVGEAKMLLLQAEMCYNGEDQLDEAAALAREAVQLFEQEEHELGQAQAWMAVAEAYMAGGKHKAAVHPAQKAARLFRQAGEEHEGIRAFLLSSEASIGVLSAGSRESTWAAWEEALVLAKEGLKKAQDDGDSLLVASAQCQLAEVYNSTGSYDDALKASKESADLYHDSGSHPQEEASALHWMADTHMKCERMKDAREVTEKIRKLGQKHEDAGIEQLAEDVLESMRAPGASTEDKGLGEKLRGTADEEPRPPPPPPGKLVRNQQGDVMDLASGLTFKPVPMNPTNIVDITARILASYTGEEFDNEIPLMQAGIVGPLGAELRSEWQRKYVPTTGSGRG